MTDSALPKGSLVLVTGASGFIGSHVADALLAAGYRVRGTARDGDKAGWIGEFFDARHGKGKFEAVVVADMAADGAFDGVMEGCQGVAHIASDMTFRADPNAVIPPVVSGMRNVLGAAAAHPSVQRFVLCSSSTAATLPKPGKEFTVTADTWNDEAVAAAWAPPPYEAERAFTVYGASKTEAERAAWAFVAERAPGFALSTVLPNFNIGEILVPARQAGSTGGMIKKLWEGEQGTVDFLAGFDPQYFVAVKDVAALHVAALAFADVAGERLLAFAGPFNFDDLVDTMRAIRPSGAFPAARGGLQRDLSTVKTERSVEILRRMGKAGFMGLEESIRDCVGE